MHGATAVHVLECPELGAVSGRERAKQSIVLSPLRINQCDKCPKARRVVGFDKVTQLVQDNIVEAIRWSFHQVYV